MKITGLILAAGFGTRLRPSTQYCPKPLIPVGGVEPLFHAIYQMQEMGIENVIVNAHYLHGHIKEALETWKVLFPSLKIHLSVELPNILGTGGSIQKVLKDYPELFQEQGLLVMNGDTLAAFEMSPLVNDTSRSTFAISNWAEHLTKYKPLWVDAKGAWVGIGATPPEEGARAAHFLGLHYLNASAINELKKLLPETIIEVDLFNGIYRPLTERGHILCETEMIQASEASTYSEKLFWFDMTNPEYLLEAQRFVMSHLSGETWWTQVLKARYPNIKHVSPGIWVNASQKIKCSFLGPAIYVENENSSHQRQFSSLNLGPDAALIFDGGQVDWDLQENNPLMIRNSVVLIARKETGIEVPSLIENDVRVI